MKRLLACSAAALVLLAAAALIGVGRPDSARGDTTQPDVVTTSGHGVVSAVPDEATVTAGVQTNADTAAAALAENAQRMTAVIAAVKAAGGDQVQTQEVSLQPQTNNDGAVTGYVAQNSVSAEAKIADAGALVDAAVGAGANTIDGPSLSVSDTDALYRKALGLAVADARAKALALADAGGFGVGPVSSVTEDGTEPQPVFAKTPGALNAAAQTPVEAGTQDVTADVTVSFTIR